MRTQLIYNTRKHKIIWPEIELGARSSNEALDLVPWAGMLVPVASGWLAFESYEDYKEWEAQR